MVMMVMARTNVATTRLVLALELAFALLALLALLVLGRGLLLGSRDSACLLAALGLVLQGARLAVRRPTGETGEPHSCECQSAQTQDDGLQLAAAGRCEMDRRGEVRRDSRPSALGNDEARSADRERWRCMLCGQDGPSTQQASAASSRCSSAPDDRFTPCVLCGSAREQQRAAARAHEVRAKWRLPQSNAQCVCTVLQAGTADEVARASSPGLSTPSDQRRMATRVRACLAHLALEGHRGRSMHASIEHTDGCAYLVLRRPGSGAAVSQMLLSGLELVDIGKGRVLIVPDLEPSELTLDGVGVLTLKQPEEFWDMVHRAGKTAVSRAGIWDMLRLNSPRAPSTSAPAHRRREDSPRRLSATSEVSRADTAGAEGPECAHARAAWSSSTSCP